MLALACTSTAWAGPPESDKPSLVEVAQPVIPPGREELARALLDDLPEPERARFIGPTIERDAVLFELREGETRLATLRLDSLHRAEPGEPTSESFVIRTELAEGTAREQVGAALASATASIQAHDHGGFYVLPKQAPRNDRPKDEPPLQVLAPEPDRTANRTRWAWQTGSTLLLLLTGVAVLLRPRAPGAEPGKRVP